MFKAFVPIFFLKFSYLTLTREFVHLIHAGQKHDETIVQRKLKPGWRLILFGAVRLEPRLLDDWTHLFQIWHM